MVDCHSLTVPGPAACNRTLFGCRSPCMNRAWMRSGTALLHLHCRRPHTTVAACAPEQSYIASSSRRVAEVASSGLACTLWSPYANTRPGRRISQVFAASFLYFGLPLSIGYHPTGSPPASRAIGASVRAAPPPGEQMQALRNGREPYPIFPCLCGLRAQFFGRDSRIRNRSFLRRSPALCGRRVLEWRSEWPGFWVRLSHRFLVTEAQRTQRQVDDSQVLDASVDDGKTARNLVIGIRVVNVKGIVAHPHIK